MAKKSQRRAVRYEKDKSGCMWGFISMFDFRHGHPTRKLIADKRRSHEHAVGYLHSMNKFEVLSNLDEVDQSNLDIEDSKRVEVKTDINKPSVKKLIEEEMFVDQNPLKDIDNAELESKESRLRYVVPLKVDSKRKKKSFKKSHYLDTDDLNLDATLKSEFSYSQHSRQQSKDNIDLDKVTEEFSHLKDACSMMRGNDREVLAQSKHKHAISENIARDAIHEFVNQMILNGKDLAEAKKFLCSDELKEALELISSDKDFFLSLRQDPKSLLSKYVENFVNSRRENEKEYGSVSGSNFSEQELGNLENTKEIVNQKKHNFFRRKVKSQSKISTNENGNTDFSNRIVILKPGPMDLKNSATENNIDSPIHSHDKVHYNSPSVRGGSHFSLTELKRKLKHAMGREKHGNSEGISRKYPAESQNKRPSAKAIGKDNSGMRSPNKDHFFIEKIARRTNGVMKVDKSGTLKDSELVMELENSSYPKPRISNLYIEAKKHLSEIVSNGDENIDLSSRRTPSTLGRILSLPEYNFSPLGSPVRDWEHHFVTAQTRFSAQDKNWDSNEDNLSPEQATSVDHSNLEADNEEKQSCICSERSCSNDKVQETKSGSKFSDDQGHVDEEENSSLVRDEIVIEDDIESEKEIDILATSSEPVCLGTGKVDQHDNFSEIHDSASCSQCLKQNVTDENQSSSPLSSPSHLSTTMKVEELESGSDISGRPSPVSVLDTFLEDDISLVEVRVRPLKFEEQDSSPVNQFHSGKHCLEDKELIYDYIKEVLQTSGLTKDQLFMKCLSSDKILDPSLFDQVELLSSHLCPDQKLLYDCTNEVLMEVCWHYFGVSPFASFLNPSIRPTPNMQKVILKVWEGVCWHFLPTSPPLTLEKNVRKDMEKNGAWMDLRFEAETVDFEMGEAILSELMEDTILSCVSESSESKCCELST
ncbi:hypothetical protein TanjilG_06880 [Lupinus angustifolius]|uniref:DUF4378 domain-containing protein n=1 Tax=Lupinus angustifolius TaxID=3871 RepID=A0A4P1RRS0_LUPAN|nr:PREDICTED: intracellular protein transport protein USO1-like [Lupinus angustifolius]XP_019428581.1 PREDICTED: intracellular protein transport protein USO1-like [Lupinus angustifolius]XP_019428590.1 PREDICTED: intracellular protein transport protein USO1-like [Lupinus angustifolius]XP_019428597.1 PREDICTED: intracellular protein transport protein USO1-like [Lupinus angustifolius]XP_019428606.1 PREDICTED: intracellular protein transport protein USO1-like [Lupinus angustifolius]XP_019428615.1 